MLSRFSKAVIDDKQFWVMNGVIAKTCCPPLPHMPLNDTAIKALKPGIKPYKRFGGTGLYLEVLPTGTKTWRVKYRFEGKAKSPITLGHYPVVGLRDARRQLLDI